jgi:hypothetical protein
MYAELRRTFGKSYCSVFPEGLTVPWKPLSLKDYLSYSDDTARGLYPIELIEDEIFAKCVQDESLVRQAAFQKAGVVQVVVSHIWQVSGPIGSDGFNADLDTAREMLNPVSSQSLYHSLVNLITTAYSYLPEQVYEMDYKTLLIRAAMAESKLINLGILTEPIQAYDPTQQPQKRPRPNLKAMYEQQQRMQESEVGPTMPMEDITKYDSEKWWDESPVGEVSPTHGIDFRTEAMEQNMFGMSGHEKADAPIAQAEMIENAQHIYKDLLARLDRQKKTD